MSLIGSFTVGDVLDQIPRNIDQKNKSQLVTSDLPSLTVAWVALDHGVGGLKAGVGDFSHVQRLVVSLLRRDDRGVSHKGEVNPEESRLNEAT